MSISNNSWHSGLMKNTGQSVLREITADHNLIRCYFLHSFKSETLRPSWEPYHDGWSIRAFMLTEETDCCWRVRCLINCSFTKKSRKVEQTRCGNDELPEGFRAKYHKLVNPTVRGFSINYRWGILFLNTIRRLSNCIQRLKKVLFYFEISNTMTFG